AVALRQPDAAEVEALPEGDAARLVRAAPDDELGRAAADVADQRLGQKRRAGGHAAERQLRLLVTAQQPRLEAVAPLALAEEGLAVLGVADRARTEGERPLGAERLHLAPEVGQHVPHARDRRRQ